jgi:hypothetical protein
MDNEKTDPKKSPLGLVLVIGGIVLAFFAYKTLTKPKYPTGMDAGLAPKTGLVDALLGNDTTKCTYSDSYGEVTIWAKAGKVRSEGSNYGVSGDQKGGMINDGEYLYIWQDSDKTGLKYKLSVFENEASQDGTMPSGVDPEAWAEMVQAQYQYSCSATNETDNIFTPPADIVFDDMTQLLEKAEEFSQTFSASDSQEAIDQKMEEIKGMMDEIAQ